MRLVAVVVVVAGWFTASAANVVAQASSGSSYDLSPFAQWGVAGVLLSFLLWQYVAEQKQHRKLQEKVLKDVIPALLQNNQLLGEAVDVLKKVADRPSVAPEIFGEWVQLMRELRDRIDRDRRA